MVRKLLILSITTILIFIANNGLTKVWYVIYPYPDNPGDGASWHSPLTKIEDALDRSEPYDEIWVATPIVDTEIHTNAPLEIDKPIEIYGGFVGGESSREERRNKSVITGANSVGNCFKITSNATIDGFFIKDFINQEKGGGVYIEAAAPTIRNCTIDNNQARFGGGIYTLNAKPTLDNCLIKSNKAWEGAGIYSVSSTIRIKDCSIISNEAINPENGKGGGIYAQNSKAFINDSLFQHNISEINGGAFCIYESVISCKNTLFDKNSSYTGAIFLDSCPDVSFANCEFENSGSSQNFKAGNGGAIHNRDSQVLISDCYFHDNQAYYGGGAIYAQWAGNSIIQNSKFYDNYTTNWYNAPLEQGGGAILQKGSVAIKNCNFTRNAVAIEDAEDGYSRVFDTKGGAIRSLQNDVECTIDGCEFYENQAYFGGAIFDSNLTSKVINSSFEDNMATRGAGIYYFKDTSQDSTSRPFLGNCYFGFNVAHEDGGAIYNDSMDTIIAHSTFRKNSCEYYGGAAYFTGDNGPDGIEIINSIFWENDSIQIPCKKEIGFSLDSTYFVTNCDIDHIPSKDCTVNPFIEMGNNNIQEPPLFHSSSGARIQSTSPCRDTGTNDSILYLLPYDYEGDPRIVGTRPDIGADEFLLRAEIDIMPNVCPNIIQIDPNTTESIKIDIAIVNLWQLDAGLIGDTSVELLYGGYRLSPIDKRIEDISRRVTDRDDICDCPTRGGDGNVDFVYTFEFDNDSIEQIDKTKKFVLNLEGETSDGRPFLGRDCLTFNILKSKIKKK